MTEFAFYPEGIKPGALVPVRVPSIYKDYTAPLPARMAWLAPEAAEALEALCANMEARGGKIYLSDCFRAEMDQARACFDYLTGTGKTFARHALVGEYPILKNYVASNDGRGKTAFSPRPGYGFHEAGRAVDIDVDPKRLGMDQRAFAEIAHACGWRDIVHNNFGNPRLVDVTEEWHWEFLGPFRAVYDDLLGRLKNRKQAYAQTAHQAVVALKAEA